MLTVFRLQDVFLAPL